MGKLTVDERGKHGLILASGESFRANGVRDDKEARESLLTVITRDLGQVTWRVDFEPEFPPQLCLNNAIPSAIERIRSDPEFQALVLPAALRQILIWYLWNDPDENDAEWNKWLAFAKMFGEEIPRTNDQTELLNWVDELIMNFSTRFEMCDRLVNTLREEQ